jgi:hypothetical protein
MKLMEITIKDLKDFRVWLKKTYGPQDAFEYEHTFTEEIAIRYAQHKQKLNIHGVMQAEASAGAEGAAVASGAAGKGVSGGIEYCPTCLQEWK